MSEQRKSRDLDSRKASERPSDKWVPPSILPEPNPIEGYVFRWIRTSALGHADNTNVSQKFREGWEPVKAEDHPELQVMSDIHSQFKGNVEIGGLLLCKAPVEIMAQREEHYQGVAKQQLESVDQNLMRENDARMPLFHERKSTRSNVGKG